MSAHPFIFFFCYDDIRQPVEMGKPSRNMDADKHVIKVFRDESQEKR